MKATSLSALALVLLASVTAHADNPPADGGALTWRDRPRFNVGASVGNNSPAGLLGVEIDYRLAKYVSVGVAGGFGMWGKRISPNAKLELQTGPKTGLFLEGALSINTGGGGSTTTDGETQELRRGVVPAAAISFGGRIQRLGPFWTGARVGFNFALRKNAYEVMGGGEPSELTRALIDATYPGGLVVSWMAGTSF